MNGLPPRPSGPLAPPIPQARRYSFPSTLTVVGLPDASSFSGGSSDTAPVTTEDQVRRIFDHVSGVLADRYDMRLWQKLLLQTVEAGDASMPLDRGGNTNHFFKDGVPWHRITVRLGFSAATTATICAHEFGHAWLTDYCPNLAQIRPPAGSQNGERFSEGFASWLEFKFCCAERTPEAAAYLAPDALSDRPPEYSEGLARMLQIEKAHGELGVFRYATTGVVPGS